MPLYQRLFWVAVAGVVLVFARAVIWRPAPRDRTVANQQSPSVTTSAIANHDRGPDRAGQAILRDVAAAIQELNAQTDSMARDKRAEAIVAGVPVSDLDAWVRSLAQQEVSGAGRDLESRLIRRWAEADPHAAAVWVTQMAPGNERQQALESVAIAWANQQLSASIAWAQQLPSGVEQNAVLMSIATEAARSEPLQALNLLVGLPDSSERDQMVQHASAQWAVADPKAAVDWAKQIQDPLLRDSVLSDIAAVWSKRDPASAAALAVESINAGKAQDDAVVQIVQRWVATDASAAANWVVAFPEGSLRETAMENLVKLWAEQDPERAGEWLNGLEAGTGHDAGVATYVRQLEHSNPVIAAKWVGSIADEKLRQATMTDLGESWLSVDASAARQWIAQSELPEATKAKLLSQGL